ncbi:MAG: hypothetical protein ABIP90_11600 [Vicinamibacterales bacterium]
MNIGRRVWVEGVLATALAILFVPVAAAEADTPTVRVTRPVAGRIVLDVADDTVAVRKEITADRSVVTLTTAKDRLSITVRRGMLTISGPGGAMSMDPARRVDADRLLVLLQRSDAAARARTMLAMVSEGPNTFAGQSLLLTRAILEVGTGSVNALNQHQQWVAERAAAMPWPGQSQGAPRVIRASYLESTQKGPGDCWDLYSKEAIRIAQDFAECTDDLKWYEAHLWAGCSLVYAVRSEGAMAWFISCNGGVPFHG